MPAVAPPPRTGATSICSSRRSRPSHIITAPDNGFSCVAGVDSGNNQKLMIRNRVNTVVGASDADEGVTDDTG